MKYIFAVAFAMLLVACPAKTNVPDATDAAAAGDAAAAPAPASSADADAAAPAPAVDAAPDAGSKAGDE